MTARMRGKMISGSGNPRDCSGARREILPESLPGKGGGGAEVSPAFFKASLIRLIYLPFLSFEFCNRFADQPVVNAVLLLDKTRQQTFVADRINKARYPLGVAINPPNRRLGKDRRALRARNGQPMLHILSHFVKGESLEMVADGDPLPELPQVVLVEPISKFRLPQEHNL